MNLFKLEGMIRFDVALIITMSFCLFVFIHDYDSFTMCRR